MSPGTLQNIHTVGVLATIVIVLIVFWWVLSDDPWDVDGEE